MISLAIYVTLNSSVILYVLTLHLIKLGELIKTSITTNTNNNRPGWVFNKHFDVPQDEDEVATYNLCGDSLKRGTFWKE